MKEEPKGEKKVKGTEKRIGDGVKKGHNNAFCSLGVTPATPKEGNAHVS